MIMNETKTSAAAMAADMSKQDLNPPQTSPRYMLACDFDGTLFRHDGRGFLLQDLEAILEFRRQGGLVGLNTGRGLKAFEPDLLESGQDLYNAYAFDFFGASSGAEIADRDGNLFSVHVLSPQILQTCEELFGEAIQFACVDGVYCRRRGFDSTFPINGDHFDSLNEFAGRHITTLALVFDDEQGEERKKACIKILESCDLPIEWFANLDSIDIVASPCSKAYCLEELSRHYGIDMKHVYAIGDGLNDKPALDAAAAGFAIASGDKALVSQADYVVEDVAEAIRKIEELEGLCPEQTEEN